MIMSDSEIENIFNTSGPGRSPRNKPHIDLYNFDNPKFQDSRYVLTSPRSLEACSKYGIKPVELLYKPLSDFQDELTPQGVPVRTVFNLYDSHESERLQKLKSCREERERLVMDEVRHTSRSRTTPKSSRNPEPVSDFSTNYTSSSIHHRSFSPSSTPWKSSQFRHSSSEEDINSKWDESQRHLFDDGRDGSRKSILKSSRTSSALTGLKDAMSTNQQSSSSTYRTNAHSNHALSASEGRIRSHRGGSLRRTYDEDLRDSSRSGHKSSRTMSALAGLQDAMSANGHSLSFSQKSLSRPSNRMSDSDEDSGYEFDSGSIQRRRTAWATSTSTGPVRRTLDQPAKRSLSRSLSDLGQSVTGSSPRSRASSPDSARPITNRKLRKKLKAGDSVVTDKDQKILEAMVSKHEQEIADRKNREKANHLWEAEKKKAQHEKELRDQQHRQEMEEQKNARELERMERRKEHEARQASIKADREAAAELSRQQWEATSTLQQQMKEHEIQEKKRVERLRKQSQEKMKELYEKENRDYQEFVNHKQQFDLTRANMKKDLSLSEKQWNQKRSNELSKYQHKERYTQMEKQKKRDMKALKTSLELKHLVHENKFSEIVDNREHQKQLSQMEREHKLERTREAQEMMNRELDEWKDTLKLHRQINETKANQTAKHNLENRQRKVFEDRTRRETSQKLNMQSYNKERKTWVKDMKGYIAMQDVKTKGHLNEKDYIAEKSRSMAATSQRLRDEVRKRYDMDTFDKKVQKVKLESRVGAGVYSATKNMSTLKIV